MVEKTIAWRAKNGVLYSTESEAQEAEEVRETEEFTRCVGRKIVKIEHENGKYSVFLDNGKSMVFLMEGYNFPYMTFRIGEENRDGP